MATWVCQVPLSESWTFTWIGCFSDGPQPLGAFNSQVHWKGKLDLAWSSLLGTSSTWELLIHLFEFISNLHPLSGEGRESQGFLAVVAEKTLRKKVGNCLVSTRKRLYRVLLKPFCAADRLLSKYFWHFFSRDKETLVLGIEVGAKLTLPIRFLWSWKAIAHIR